MYCAGEVVMDIGYCSTILLELVRMSRSTGFVKIVSVAVSYKHTCVSDLLICRPTYVYTERICNELQFVVLM